MRRIAKLSFGRSDIGRDVDRELTLHLDLRTEELIAQGLSPAEARRQAQAAFGNVNELAAECGDIRQARERDRRRRSVMDALTQDLRYALRVLLRAPGFTLTALLTLALGIGGSAALFSIVYALLVQPLPFTRPEELLFITEANPAQSQSNFGISAPLAQDFAERSHTVVASGVFGRQFQARVMFNSEPEFLSGASLSEGAFKALAVNPVIGRIPTAGEHTGSGAQVVLLSYGLWQTQFGASRAVLGRTIALGGVPLTIIGVLPASFAFPTDGLDIWIPQGETPPELSKRSVHIFSLVARRQAGVTLEDVRSELQGIYAQSQQQEPGSDGGHTINVVPLREAFVGNVRSSVLLLFGAVVMVLLIVCGNLAGLQIARAAARAPEFALRTALGAGRFAVVRQLLVESGVVALTGCLLGVALAQMLLRWLIARFPQHLPFPGAIRVNGSVLLFVAGITAFAVLLFGLLPALLAARARSASEAIGSRRSTLDRRRHRMRAVLVGAQLALALVLTTGASLVVRSFLAAQSQNPGFTTDNLLLLNITPSDRLPDEQVTGFYQRLPQLLNVLPGVVTASASNSLPISGGDSRGGLSVEGRPFDSGTAPTASYRRVLPSYFRSIGIPLIAGREFNEQDRGQDPKVVIVNRTLAERQFGSAANAIGRRIKVGVPENEPWVTIVGVVGDVRNERMEANDDFATYEPHPQRPWRSMQVVLRTHGPAIELAPVVRAALRRADPDIVIADVSTMQERISASLAPRRFNAQLLSAFGLLALTLAAIGVYGIVLFLVNERRREFGIRVALGATAGEIRTLVLSRAGRLLLAGGLVGVTASLLLTRYLRTLLYQVQPLDPVSLAIALGLLCSMVLLATLGPALRAARADVRSALTE